MIVKVQISLSTSETEPQVLIYNADRTFFEILPLSDCVGLEDAMADAGPARRAYFHGEIVSGKIHLNGRAPKQEW